MSNVPMTIAGAEQLQKELERLKRQRPEIVKAIAEARAHGDLKENAEYHAAKEQQGLAEARIRDIEAKLSNATIVDITKIPNHGRVIFCATIHLLNIDSETEVVYKLVGEDETDVEVGKISILSPLARALVGKHIGDVIEFSLPSGIVNYEITAIEHV